MFARKRKLLAILMVAAGGGMAFGNIFIWTGGGTDLLWTNPSNWDLRVCEEPSCPSGQYPDDATDDAVFNAAGTYNVDVPTVPIDLLSINRGAAGNLNVVFNSSSTSNIVTADSVYIKSSGVGGALVTFSITEGVQVLTTP